MFHKDIWIKTFLALDEHHSRAVALHCNFDAFERSYTFITAYYLLFYHFFLLLQFYYWNAEKYLQEQYFITAQKRKRRTACKHLEMGCRKYIKNINRAALCLPHINTVRRIKIFPLISTF